MMDIDALDSVMDRFSDEMCLIVRIKGRVGLGGRIGLARMPQW